MKLCENAEHFLDFISVNNIIAHGIPDEFVILFASFFFLLGCFTNLVLLLYHFVQLVRVVMRDRLDEILDSSYWSYSHDIPSILSLRLMM